MDEVNLDKKELLAKLKENRAKHVQLYKDALEGFYVDRAKVLESALAKIKSGKTPHNQINFVEPVNHESQYDEAIAMLEMSVDKQVTLSRHEFSQYVQDSWISRNEMQMLRGYALSSSNAGFYK